jgi:O-antigen/teichoic acid export membrane protein
VNNLENNALRNKNNVKNIAKVTISNFFKLFSGVLVGFLLPKILGITDYGYYKTFTLYATYVGMFHFGICDGIYLMFGGKDYDELDRYKFRFYTVFLIALELIVSIILTIVSIATLPGELKFVFICLSLYLFSNNITVYFQFISQITSRFGELSIRNIIQSCLTTTSIIFLWFLYKFTDSVITYKLFTVIYVLITVILSVWYLFTYREITIGKRTSLKNAYKDIFKFLQLGFPLMIANLCSTLILTLDRQVVNIYFDKETYAIYAFAYNMLSLVTTATAAISTVLYPTLKRTDESELKKSYSGLINLVLVMVFGCMLAYYPLCLFVSWFLPKYIDSLKIFRIAFPGIAFSSAITIVMHNYYKTLQVNLIFFIKGILILIVSLAANVSAYFIFHTPESISIASLISMIIWYVISEEYFIRKFKINWFKNFSYLLIMTFVFYCVSIIKNYYFGFAIQFLLFLLITYVFNYKMINSKIDRVLSKFKIN